MNLDFPSANSEFPSQLLVCPRQLCFAPFESSDLDHLNLFWYSLVFHDSTFFNGPKYSSPKSYMPAFEIMHHYRPLSIGSPSKGFIMLPYTACLNFMSFRSVFSGVIVGGYSTVWHSPGLALRSTLLVPTPVPSLKLPIFKVFHLLPCVCKDKGIG